ncbi:thiamine phosphate synthase [Hydrogenimonas urashimensis]|uniref:thiamine phosphate synthase n=1 Tax=Hydrogenimonas urashimensis TaxID=2740515 RepID=UPI0019157E82|nr:thiamine phosphate synthase [Hydrogenimonas urashimensis]
MILRYAITDPAYYTSDPAELRRRVRTMLAQHGAHMVCLRDKECHDYHLLAEAFLSLKPEFPGTKFLLHTDFALAERLEADGVHLPSGRIDDVTEVKKRGLWCIVSTHTPEEITLCEKKGADAVTYSPIFATPGKGEPKGLEKLKEIKDKISLKLFALGGIVSIEQVKAVERAGADGFASIRYFVE